MYNKDKQYFIDRQKIYASQAQSDLVLSKNKKSLDVKPSTVDFRKIHNTNYQNFINNLNK